MASLRILLVQQGRSGGIGRVGKLLTEALGELSRRSPLEVSIVKRTGDEAGSWSERRLSFGAHVLLAFYRFQPHLVIFDHVHVAPLRFGMFGNARFVTIVYGWDVWLPISSVRRRALASMNAVWSISEYTTGRMRDQGIQTPAYLLRLGLDDRRRRSLKAASKRVRRSGGLRLLSVARLDPREQRKGIDHVIEALPAIAKELPHVRYAIVGEGGDRERLQMLAHERGVAELTEFRGHVSESELVRSFGECDVFILPSGQEGFGLVFVEAMAAGRPIVAARVGGVPEVVVADETGVLVDYGEVEQITRSVIRLLLDPGLRVTLGQAGQQRVQQYFSMPHVVETVAWLLHSVCGSRLPYQFEP